VPEQNGAQPLDEELEEEELDEEELDDVSSQ